MKPVFKCDYCSHMGTEEEIKVHEVNCINNYDMRSCYTCIYKQFVEAKHMNIKYECKAGKDIPEGKIYQNCDLYEQKDINSNSCFGDFFGGLFSGFGATNR